jgi:hypothetical protein
VGFAGAGVATSRAKTRDPADYKSAGPRGLMRSLLANTLSRVGQARDVVSGFRLNREKRKVSCARLDRAQRAPEFGPQVKTCPPVGVIG